MQDGQREPSLQPVIMQAAAGHRMMPALQGKPDFHALSAFAPERKADPVGLGSGGKVRANGRAQITATGQKFRRRRHVWVISPFTRAPGRAAALPDAAERPGRIRGRQLLGIKIWTTHSRITLRDKHRIAALEPAHRRCGFRRLTGEFRLLFSASKTHAFCAGAS